MLLITNPREAIIESFKHPVKFKNKVIYRGAVLVVFK